MQAGRGRLKALRMGTGGREDLVDPCGDVGEEAKGSSAETTGGFNGFSSGRRTVLLSAPVLVEARGGVHEIRNGWTNSSRSRVFVVVLCGGAETISGRRVGEGEAARERGSWAQRLSDISTPHCFRRHGFQFDCNCIYNSTIQGPTPLSCK